MRLLKVLFFSLCLVFSVQSEGICSEYHNLTEVQMLETLQINLQQVKKDNLIALNELEKCKTELTSVKENSEATTLELKNANELLKNYSNEQKAKIKKLKAERNALVALLTGLAVAVIIK